LSDLTPLSNLTELTDLNLRETTTSDISILARLIKLQQLQLGQNEISDISVLAIMPDLTYLILILNPITDISPLLLNEGLGEGDHVDLSYIPGIDCEDASVQNVISTLRDRGVDLDIWC
jgi:internalin A